MRHIFALIGCLFLGFVVADAQSGDFEGKVKVSDMATDNSTSAVVVRQSDGTLAQRDASSIAPLISVSLTGDTLFQGDGNWVIIPGISSVNTVTYRVTFDAVWSAATHPTSFPFDPHFSGLIGMTHRSDTDLFVPQMLASPGIKSMAEFGSKFPLQNEINDFINAGGAQSVISGGGIGQSPGSVSVQFDLTNSHSLVSLVSMVAPSPDWFIGVKDVALFENGTWVNMKTVGVNIYDAGTDSGPDYMSPNQPTIPPVGIFMITDPPLGTNGVVPSLGSMTFERID